MPVNYLDINHQIPAFCEHAILRQKELAMQKEEALKLAQSARRLAS